MLGKYARVKVVMPIGSTDGTGYRYPLNYGTVYGEKDQTAYIMGTTTLCVTLTGV